jgi:hypothetical protein
MGAKITNCYSSPYAGHFMMPPMRLVALLLALLFPLQDALAQKKQQMSPEQRQRLRQDVREVYKDRQRQERPRQMTRDDRERLRRDVDEANRRLKR